MRELLAELTAALEQRRDLVYCVLVETRGSTPQKAGAAMLVFADGSQRGTLGGGCVEAEVWAEAREALRTGRAALHRFTLTADEASEEGMVCGGTMEIFIDVWDGAEKSGDDLQAATADAVLTT